jgi:hypothetical protein
MSMVKDIKKYLTDEGINMTVYIASMPNGPDDCVCLYQYAGKPPDTAAQLQRPGLNIKSRSVDYETALTNIETIADKLCQIGDEISGDYPEGKEINGTLYLGIYQNQSAFPLGRDENGRFEIVQNFSINRRKI